MYNYIFNYIYIYKYIYIYIYHVAEVEVTEEDTVVSKIETTGEGKCAVATPDGKAEGRRRRR